MTDVALTLTIVGDASPLPAPVTRGETITLRLAATDRATGAAVAVTGASIIVRGPTGETVYSGGELTAGTTGVWTRQVVLGERGRWAAAPACTGPTASAGAELPIRVLGSSADTPIPVPPAPEVVDARQSADEAAQSALDAAAAADLLGNPSAFDVVATGGTTERALEDRFAEVVNVDDHGAVGDGTTVDTAAFLAAAALGKSLVGTKGKHYRIADIALAAGQEWDGRGCTVQPAAGATSCFTRIGAGFGGGIYRTTFTDPTNICRTNTVLTAAALAGATTIAVGSAAGLAFNEQIFIVCDTLDGGAKRRIHHTKVDGISGLTITLKDPLPWPAAQGREVMTSRGILRIDGPNNFDLCRLQFNSVSLGISWQGQALGSVAAGRSVIDRVDFATFSLGGIYIGHDVRIMRYQNIIGYGNSPEGWRSAFGWKIDARDFIGVGGDVGSHHFSGVEFLGIQDGFWSSYGLYLFMKGAVADVTYRYGHRFDHGSVVLGTEIWSTFGETPVSVAGGSQAAIGLSRFRDNGPRNLGYVIEVEDGSLAYANKPTWYGDLTIRDAEGWSRQNVRFSVGATLHEPGAPSLPGVAFRTDTDTGWYSIGNNEWRFSAAGENTVNLGPTGLQTLSGSTAAAAYSFVGDGDTGVFRPGANQVGIAAGGQRAALFTATGTAFELPISPPAITFTNLPETSTPGFTYRVTDRDHRFATWTGSAWQFQDGTADGTGGAGGGGASIAVAPNRAAMLALPLSAYSTDKVVQLLGYHALDGKGAGLFEWDAASTATVVEGMVERPGHVSSGDPGRLIRLLPEGKFTLWDTGARWDGTTDDIAAWNRALAFLMANPALKLEIPPGEGYLNAGRTTILTTPVSIEGAGVGISIIRVGPAFRGPLFYLEEWFGLDEITPAGAEDGGGDIKGFTCSFDFFQADGETLLPKGVQHGFFLAGRMDLANIRDVNVEGVRGHMLASGYGTALAGIGWDRERAGTNLRARRSGAGPEFGVVEFVGHSLTQEQTNETENDGWELSLNNGPLRFKSRPGVKTISLVKLNKWQVHNFNASIGIPADCDPRTSGQLWHQMEIDGNILSVKATDFSFNASVAGQHPVWIDNRYSPRVTLASNAIATGSGSALVTVTLPALGAWELQQGDVRTLDGSPLLYIRESRLSGHTLAAILAAGGRAWVTFDRISGGERTALAPNWNGVIPWNDMEVLAIRDGWVWVNPYRGLSRVADGDVTLPGPAEQRTLSQSYGFLPGSEVTFDRLVGGRMLPANIAVGGLTLAGDYTVETMSALNVFTFDAGSNAASTATSSLATGAQIILNEQIRGPLRTKVHAVASSGARGPAVMAGGEHDIRFEHVPSEVNSSVRFPDLVVGDRLTAPFRYEGREGAVVQAAAVDQGLVHSHRAVSWFLPVEASRFVLLGGDQARGEAGILRFNRAGTAPARLTADGGSTLSLLNTWPFLLPGTWQLEGLLTAHQYTGSTGAVGDHAAWALMALFTYDGTPANLVCRAVNGLAANVGASLPPSIPAGPLDACRAVVSADTTYGAPAIVGVGLAGRTIAWGFKGSVFRVGGL